MRPLIKQVKALIITNDSVNTIDSIVFPCNLKMNASSFDNSINLTCTFMLGALKYDVTMQPLGK